MISDEKLAHLSWAIKSRTRNQVCAHKLLTLFKEYEASWSSQNYSRAAQELVSVTFSLWRAAFLADKISKRGIVFAHGAKFLERVVEDNAISYPQDKDAREWTFNYYTRVARSSLIFLETHRSKACPKFKDDTRTATERWDYCQSILEQAVENFGKHLQEVADNKIAKKKKRERKKTKSAQRAKVRALKNGSPNSL